MARPGEEEREPLLQGAPLVQPVLFHLYKEEPGGGRPAPLPKVAGPLDRIQQCTAEQTVDTFVLALVVDAPLPQMVDQLVDFHEIIDRLLPVVAEQVINMAKINLLVQIPQCIELRALLMVGGSAVTYFQDSQTVRAQPTEEQIDEIHRTVQMVKKLVKVPKRPCRL